MKSLLLSILFLFYSFHLTATESASLYFQETNSQETATIQDHLVDFYGEELYTAGLFKDLDQAKQAAKEEWAQEVEDSNKTYHCYHLVSPDSNDQYGYLVFSVEDQASFLEAIYLNTAYRGRGLGKRALEILETNLINKGVHTIKLHVFAHSTTAFSLYTRMGYEIENTYFDGERPGCYIGHKSNNISFLKKVL